MIQIWGAGHVFICDEDFHILHNGGIAFTDKKDKILEVGDYEQLCQHFPEAQKHFFSQGILLPALINAHIHFEFGSHISHFAYGDFGEWLDSLMSNRDAVLPNTENLQEILTQGIREQLLCGVGSVGAISSYGEDMHTLANSPLRVVYFNEAIGSNPSAIDFLYSNFTQRLNDSQKLASETFIPAIALHSPYSLHPIMTKKLIEITRLESLPLSTHFLESLHEREWLTQNAGYFRVFFQNLANISDPKSFYTPQEFLDLLTPLTGKVPISLTHALFAQKDEFEYISKLQASIISCPRSNRLLNNTFFSRHEALSHHIPIALGTDGKSSNNNVNLLDELRIALYAYPQENLMNLAKSLILSATLYGAKALGLNNGSLKPGKNVDFALFEFDEILKQAPLSFILHAKTPKHLYINAKAII